MAHTCRVAQEEKRPLFSAPANIPRRKTVTGRWPCWEGVCEQMDMRSVAWNKSKEISFEFYLDLN